MIDLRETQPDGIHRNDDMIPFKCKINTETPSGWVVQILRPGLVPPASPVLAPRKVCRIEHDGDTTYVFFPRWLMHRRGKHISYEWRAK